MQLIQLVYVFLTYSLKQTRWHAADDRPLITTIGGLIWTCDKKIKNWFEKMTIEHLWCILFFLILPQNYKPISNLTFISQFWENYVPNYVNNDLEQQKTIAFFKTFKNLHSRVTNDLLSATDQLSYYTFTSTLICRAVQDIPIHSPFPFRNICPALISDMWESAKKMLLLDYVSSCRHAKCKWAVMWL